MRGREEERIYQWRGDMKGESVMLGQREEAGKDKRMREDRGKEEVIKIKVKDKQGREKTIFFNAMCW